MNRYAPEVYAGIESLPLVALAPSKQRGFGFFPRCVGFRPNGNPIGADHVIHDALLELRVKLDNWVSWTINNRPFPRRNHAAKRYGVASLAQTVARTCRTNSRVEIA